jgi:hypothetical protein
MKKGSALCVKKRVNLCTKICSISSACFIRMLTRTLFTDGSIRTRSSWFRDTVNGLRMSSGDVRASISGTLCLSLACDAKLERDRAAVRVLRTQERYGLSDWDWRGVSGALRSLCCWMYHCGRMEAILLSHSAAVHSGM